MTREPHPCFDETCRRDSARVHLPVAASCNVQCNFCSRRCDCVNESRPGVTSAVLSPAAAIRALDAAIASIENAGDGAAGGDGANKPHVAVIGVAGPGDPFATPEDTLETLRLARERYPSKILCAATNGLNAAPYAARLASLGVSHVTVTINAVDPAIGAAIYPWVRVPPKIYRGLDGARILLDRQLAAVSALAAHGVTVKINTVIIPGVNDAHAPDVARTTASLGAAVQNCVPLMRVEGAAFERLPEPSPALMREIRAAAAAFLPQMSHCARCRADAAGLLADPWTPRPTPARPLAAIASREGFFINLHLGEADELWLYALENGAPIYRARRAVPNRRWDELADRLPDCFAVVSAACGPAPRRALEARGISVLTGEGLVTEIAEAVLKGHGVPRQYAPARQSAGCGGDGAGCG